MRCLHNPMPKTSQTITPKLVTDYIDNVRSAIHLFINISNTDSWVKIMDWGHMDWGQVTLGFLDWGQVTRRDKRKASRKAACHGGGRRIFQKRA